MLKFILAFAFLTAPINAWTLPMVVAQVDSPEASQESLAQQTTDDTGKVLHFPADRSLGVLYAAPADIVDNEYFNLRDNAFKRIGFAQGDVQLPSGSIIRLDVSLDACRDLRPLSQVPADAIDALRFDSYSDPSEQFDYIGKLTGLRFLDFTNVPMSDGRLLKLANLNNLEELTCMADEQAANGSGITDRGLLVVAKFKKLKRLNLCNCPITDAGLRLLEFCPSLEVLMLSGTGITGEGFDHLANLPKLQRLFLGQQVNDQGVEALSQIPQLKVLALWNSQVTDKGMKFISKLKNLDSLQLDFTQVTEDGLKHLVGLKKLRLLGFQHCVLTDVAAESLGQIPSLEHIVGHWKLTEKGFENLAKLTKLKSLSLGSETSDQQLKFLPAMVSLESLEFDSCAITDESAPQILKLTKLNRLSICGTEITGVAFDSLKSLQNLKDLEIRFRIPGTDANWPAIGELKGLVDLTVEGCKALDKTDCASLAKLTKLENLSFEEVIQGPVFFDSVKNLKQLRFLKCQFADANDDCFRNLLGLENLQYLSLGGDITDQQLLILSGLPSLRTFSNRSKFLTTDGINAFTKKSKSLQSFEHPLTTNRMNWN